MTKIKAYALGGQIVFTDGTKVWSLTCMSCERVNVWETLVTKIESQGCEVVKASSLREVLGSYDEPIKITKYDVEKLMLRDKSCLDEVFESHRNHLEDEAMKHYNDGFELGLEMKRDGDEKSGPVRNSHGVDSIFTMAFESGLDSALGG